MPAATGRRLSSVTRPSMSRGAVSARRASAVATRFGPAIAAANGPVTCTPDRSTRLEAHNIADIGEDDEAFKLVVAVGAAAAHAQGQVDLGAGKLGDRRHRAAALMSAHAIVRAMAHGRAGRSRSRIATRREAA